MTPEGARVRVLSLALAYDYGIEAQGPSFEAVNLVAPLPRVVGQAHTLDPWAIRQAAGMIAAQEKVIAEARKFQPDVIIYAPFQDELAPATLRQLTEIAPTVAYLFDEAWRPALARSLAEVCNWITTSAPEGIERLQRIGISNAIFSPFGFNPCVYTPDTNAKLGHDVTFVGRVDPYRQWLVSQIKRAGFRVEAWGYGWPNGRLRTHEMVATFRTSRVNLNLSNNLQWDLRYLVQRPIGLAKNVRALVKGNAKTCEMVKGRHFEIPACGGYQLSYNVAGLDRFFRLNQEIAIYENLNHLVEQLHLALDDEPTRQRVALAGQTRAWAEHSMDLRLQALLKAVTQPVHPPRRG